MPTFLALDLEGTGLLKKDNDDPHLQPGIVEFGAIKVTINSDNSWDDDFDPYSILLDPECHFEEKAQEITGIRPEDIYKQPNFREAFKDIAEFMLGVEHLVTFNGIGYDIPLLQFTLRKYGLETRFPWPPFQHDLMKIATDVLNLQGKTGNKPPKLMELNVSLFGTDFEGAHRAEADAEATMNCALKLLEQGYIRI